MLLLSAAAVASWYFSLPAPEVPSRDASGGGPPLGYYMSGASILGTDENGRVAYSLVASRLEEHPNEDRLLIVGVQIDYQPADTTPWMITAATGSAPKNRAVVDLAGDVELTSQPQNGQPIRIATQKLTFAPATSVATTDAPVTLTIGDWRFEAVGMRTHFKDQSLTLESNVHGKLGP
jgi:LPS export ABC transporter protein LptC